MDVAIAIPCMPSFTSPGNWFLDMLTGAWHLTQPMIGGFLGLPL